jgi:hypothetical protein
MQNAGLWMFEKRMTETLDVLVSVLEKLFTELKNLSFFPTGSP